MTFAGIHHKDQVSELIKTFIGQILASFQALYYYIDRQEVGEYWEPN